MAATALWMTRNRIPSHVNDASSPLAARSSDLVKLAARRSSPAERAIELCRTMLGEPLRPFAREALLEVVAHPDDESWDVAHAVYIAPCLTLWEALLRHTDYDIRVGPRFIASVSPAGHVSIRRTPWAQVPTSAQIVTALERASRRREASA